MSKHLGHRLSRRGFVRRRGGRGARGAGVLAVAPVRARRRRSSISRSGTTPSTSSRTTSTSSRRQYPEVTVNLSDFAWQTYHETMVNRFRSETPTDVAYNGGNWLEEFAAAGWVVPLEDHFDWVLGYQDKVLAFAWQDMTYNGKVYGLPYYADTITFMYNEKALEDAGISAPPQTWEEVTEQSLALKAAGMEYPFVYEFANTLPNVSEAFASMVFGRGGELIDEEQESALDRSGQPGRPAVPVAGRRQERAPDPDHRAARDEHRQGDEHRPARLHGHVQLQPGRAQQRGDLAAGRAVQAGPDAGRDARVLRLRQVLQHDPDGGGPRPGGRSTPSAASSSTSPARWTASTRSPSAGRSSRARLRPDRRCSTIPDVQEAYSAVGRHATLARAARARRGRGGRRSGTASGARSFHPLLGRALAGEISADEALEARRPTPWNELKSSVEG